MDKTTVYLPRELRWFLKDEARRTGKSQAELIREGVEALRVGRPQDLPRSIGMGRSKPGFSAADKDAWRAEYEKHLDEKYRRTRADD